MASIDKTSLREQLDKLKADQARLLAEKKLNAESQLLINGLLTLLELIVAIFLEKTTRKTSKNSSLPPSQTDKDETAVVNKTQSKGKQENLQTIDNTQLVEIQHVASVEQCNACGEDLSKVTTFSYERRTKIDIVFQKHTEHVDAEIKTCPSCETTTKGRFPKDMPGRLQYGNGVKAFAINLLVGQMVSLNRTQKLISAIIGQNLSESTLLKYIMLLHHALERWENQQKQAVIDQLCIHVDETSLRVEKKNYWIHVYSAGDITLKILHRKRGKAAVEAVGIIPRYGGVIIHDCWPAYFSYINCLHALCGSHLLRELVFVIESNDYVWAKHMKRLLQRTCKTVSERESKTLTEKELANLQKRYRCILTRGKKELPEVPDKPNGKKGKVAKSAAHNLWERFEKYETSILLFARYDYVPFTNNRGERDLRMSKVKQKVSGCFRNEEYAKAFCRISSYLQTMGNNGYNPLVAIQMAFDGAQRGE